MVELEVIFLKKIYRFSIVFLIILGVIWKK